MKTIIFSSDGPVFAIGQDLASSIADYNAQWDDQITTDDLDPMSAVSGRVATRLIYAAATDELVQKLSTVPDANRDYDADEDVCRLHKP
jgi:hypothetical protein